MDGQVSRATCLCSNGIVRTRSFPTIKDLVCAAIELANPPLVTVVNLLVQRKLLKSWVVASLITPKIWKP